MYKGVEVRFAHLIFFSKISHENEIICSDQIIHFYRIFKNEGRGGGSSKPPEPPLNPPLVLIFLNVTIADKSTAKSFISDSIFVEMSL